METLWNHSDIGCQKILQYAAKEGRSLSRKSVQGVVNGLFKKGLIAVSSEAENKILKVKINQYSPAYTREEYLAAVLQTNPMYKESRLSSVLSALLMDSKKDTIQKVYEAIINEKERRK